MTVLTHLTLSYNELTTLNQSTFTPIFSTLKSIDISENPFECSCELKWLVTWCKTSLNVRHSNQTVCSPTSSQYFKGKSLPAIDPDTLCTSDIALYCTIPFLVVGLLVSMALSYHNRWLIRYNILLLRLRAGGYEDVLDPQEHGDFEYDLNIIFCDDDTEWATEHLRPNLENELPRFRRIAFGDDHLPLGMYYVDAVLYVIEHSFKTILLLSNAAIRDQRFMMKLRTAVNHNLRSNLFIFLENTSEEAMPHVVKQRVSSQNAIYPFWSIWDIWDLSCWIIKKIIRKFVILLIITAKIILYI